MKIKAMIMLVAGAFSSPLLAQTSAVAVYCFEDNEGASVYMNGGFIGECNRSGMISEVPAGDVEIRAVKADGKDYERLYSDTIRLGSGGLTKVVVELGNPQITQAAQQRKENERIQKEKLVAEAALKRAREGDAEAMKEIADYYSQGKGVEESEEKSKYWFAKMEETRLRIAAERVRQKAKSGDIESMRSLARLYEKGEVFEKSPDKAKAWSQKADSLMAQRALSRAQQGDIHAMREVSSYYSEGKGLDKDSDKSLEWHKRAESKENYLKTIKEINKVNFLGSLKSSNNWIIDHSSDGDRAYSMTTTFPVAAVSDLVLSPSRLSKIIKLRRGIAVRPSEFKNPESMVAKSNVRQ